MSTTSNIPSRETIHQKLEQTSRLYDFAYSLKKTRIEQQHPDWSDERVHRHVIELIDNGSKP